MAWRGGSRGIHAYVPSHQDWKWCCDLVLFVSISSLCQTRDIWSGSQTRWPGEPLLTACWNSCDVDDMSKNTRVCWGPLQTRKEKNWLLWRKSTHQYWPSPIPKESYTHPILPSKGPRSLLSLLSVPPRRVCDTPPRRGTPLTNLPFTTQLLMSLPFVHTAIFAFASLQFRVL